MAPDMEGETLNEMAGPPQPVAESGNEESVRNPNNQPMMPTNVCNEPVGSNVHDGIDRIDDWAEGGQRSCVVDLTGPRENTPLTLREQSGATRQREKDEDSLQPVGNDGIGEGHATILPRPQVRRA